MGKTQEQIAITSPTMSYAFSESNLAASQTATVIPILGADLNQYVLPFAGSIVGYGVRLTGAVSAGSLDIDITIDGTSTRTIAVDTASTTEFYAPIEYGVEPFSAGDLLGVTYTSDGSLDPLTIDIGVVIYVCFDGFRF